MLVGINLLREGLDLPEVSLVAILDADKEGFLRSDRALIQTMGRAARNVNGRVVMYADQVTDSMQRAVEVTLHRRRLQVEYNEKHGIIPQTIKKGIRAVIEATKAAEEGAKYTTDKKGLSRDEQARLIKRLEKEMRESAKALEFEQAAYLRDIIIQLKSKE